MSRRCRASLVQGAGAAGDGDLSSGCDCGRLSGGPKEPCTYLLSPSFLTLDQHVALYGLGEGGNELPFGTLRQFDNGPRIPTPAFSLNNSEPKYSSDPPPAYITEIVNTDPPGSDTHHFFIQGGAFSGQANTDFRLVTGTACINVPVGTAYTSRANYGDLVMVQFAHKTSSTSGSTPPGTRVHISPIDAETVRGPSSLQKVFNAPLSYQTELFSAFINWEETIAVRLGISHNGSLNGSWFLGGLQVFITPGDAAGILICAQASLITIDNSTTETDFL